jgi:hypothetical protein
MPKILLDKSQRSTIIAALKIAAETYTQDATCCDNVRLRQQFQKQYFETIRMADIIEDADAIEVNLSEDGPGWGA